MKLVVDLPFYTNRHQSDDAREITDWLGENIGWDFGLWSVSPTKGNRIEIHIKAKAKDMELITALRWS